MTWNPDQYIMFSDHRLRPALDLLSQVPLNSPSVIYDLGCGTGNVTSLLSQHWNEAIITGIDNSREMLDKARKDHPSIEWKQDDISNFEPTSKGNLIFSNAALQWLGHHELLFPKLLSQLRPGGILAVQMPNNFTAPSHQNLYDLAQSPEWIDKLGSLVRPAPVHNINWYFDLLSPLAAKVNIWETTYFQVLAGKDAVLQWTRGTALRPFLQVLKGPDIEAFESEYAKRLLEDYPQRQDGSTLYPFSRLFIVVQLDAD
ncbi:methyltransferase domain-containing protein [Sneathiella sp.]|uniref:methyltransferase domain-containing protein n=1 Tax=Sneathiella sp. TaxID=1964365 RepID=UPI0035675729